MIPGRLPLILILAVVILTTPFPVVAQAPTKVPRIGYLSINSSSDSQDHRAAFLRGLREYRYIEGKTITIEWRFAQRKPERLPDLASALVRQKVDVIVAEGTPAVRAAKQATPTIPIVMTTVADAVGSGLVASLARPGGNVTGTSFLGTELVGKRLQLLKEAVPEGTRVAVLWHPGAHGEATVKHMREEAEGAARAMGVSLELLEARGSNEFVGVFDAMTRQRASALLVWPSPMFLAERQHLVDLAAKHQLPAIYYLREYADAGGLMSYGPSIPDLFRRAATYVDKILKGANPADLPVEQPMRFELIINLKAARALSLTIPQSLVLRADQLLE